MQLLVAVSTEYGNMVIICDQTTVKDIVINFVAFVAIVEIDNLYASSL
jgi:hypothetical protein